MVRDPAIGVLELNSIARGIICTDVMVKAAPVNIALSQTICPGKYLVMISGNEDPVRESMEVGRHYAGTYLVDDILIPNVHEQVIPAVSAVQELPGLNSVGIIETFSVAGTMSGDQSDVEAAISAGVAILDPAMLVRDELIPAPHSDLESVIL